MGLEFVLQTSILSLESVQKKSYVLLNECREPELFILTFTCKRCYRCFPFDHSSLSYLTDLGFFPPFSPQLVTDRIKRLSGTSLVEILQRKIKGRCEEMLHLTLARALSKELWLINTGPIKSDLGQMIIASVPSTELHYFETAQKLLTGVSLKTYKNIFFHTAKYNSNLHKLNKENLVLHHTLHLLQVPPKQFAHLNYGKH